MPTRIHVTTESLQPSAQRWDSAYTTFNATSSLFTSSSSIQTLEFDEITSGLMILGGNTVSLSSLANVGTGIDTEVRSLTSQWNSAYTTVNANSAVVWNYQGTDLKDLSANWQETYTTFKNASSTFLTSETDSQSLSFDEVTKDLSISNGNSVSLSALLDDTGIDTEVRALTADWVGGNDAYTNLVANSAAYLSAVDLSFLSVSANWDSVYNTVQSNSATTWNYQGTDLKALSGNWQTTYLASSAYVVSNPTGITGASALTKLIQITQAGYNAIITPSSDTLYVIVG